MFDFAETTSLLIFAPRNPAKSGMHSQQASRIKNLKELELTLDTDLGAGC